MDWKMIDRWTKLPCLSSYPSIYAYASECEAKLQQYRESVQYIQLRGESQYADLGKRLQQAVEAKPDEPLAGR